MSDVVERLDKLKKEIEITKSQTISLKASADKEEEILRSLIKEVKELGFDPKNLKEDLIKMEQEIDDKIKSKEKELSDVKIILEEIERNVRSHEIS